MPLKIALAASLAAALSVVTGWPFGEPCAWVGVAALAVHYFTRGELA